MSELREEARKAASECWGAIKDGDLMAALGRYHEPEEVTISRTLETFARRAVCAELRRLADEMDRQCEMVQADPQSPPEPANEESWITCQIVSRIYGRVAELESPDAR